MITPKYELGDKVFAKYGETIVESKILGYSIENNYESCSYFTEQKDSNFCKLFESEIHGWLNSKCYIEIEFISDIYKYIGKPTCWFNEKNIIKKIENA